METFNATKETQTLVIEKGKTYQLDNVLILAINEGDIRWSINDFAEDNEGKPAFTQWEYKFSANRTVFVKSNSEIKDAVIQIDTIIP